MLNKNFDDIEYCKHFKTLDGEALSKVQINLKQRLISERERADSAAYSDTPSKLFYSEMKQLVYSNKLFSTHRYPFRY